MADLFTSNPTVNAGSLTTGTPASAVTSVAGLKLYVGSTWVEKPLKAYIGGTWVSKPLKFYSGGTWQ